MNKQTNKLIKEVDILLELGRKLIDYGKSNHGAMELEKIREFTFWTTRTGEFISSLYPNNSQYNLAHERFKKSIFMDRLHSTHLHPLFEILGVLEAIKYEIEKGLLDDINSLLQADIFADFLEMGEYLLKEGYKDAAAVIIGSVLEDTLRKIADKNGIPTTNNIGKKLSIEPINVELVKKDVYNKLFKKQITSWADLRNNAAHGHYEQYDTKQVEAMLTFVQTFASDYLR